MNLPNLLSLFRLVLVPVFASVFFSGRPDARPLAAGVYALAFFTDIADGWIARHFNQVTPLGRILDPLADKLMTFTVILCITISDIIPTWAVVVFFCKEALMGLGALSMHRKVDDVMPANYLGKASTGFFFLICGLLVLFPAISRPWATGMITAALSLAVAAFLLYLWEYLRIVGKRKG